MADFNNRPAPRVKNAFDNGKLKLSAPTPGVDKARANLIWGLEANNPRITVYTGDPQDAGADKGYGKIVAKLDLPVFFMVMELLHRAVDFKATSETSEFKDKVENKGYTWFSGKKSERPEVLNAIWIGKDKEGVIWISVTARNRPIIKFPFAPSDFHYFVHGDGTPFTAGETSVLFSRGYIRLLEKMMSAMAVSHWVEPPPRDPPPGTQRQGGGRPNNNNASDNFSEDLPF